MFSKDCWIRSIVLGGKENFESLLSQMNVSKTFSSIYVSSVPCISLLKNVGIFLFNPAFSEDSKSGMLFGYLLYLKSYH